MDEAEASHRHSIGVAERRTGLPAHTIRAWERRYGAVEPARSEGGHRLYTDDEIRRLRLLAELTEEGHRIGRVAGLETERLREMAAAERHEREAERRGGEDGDTVRELVEELLEAVRGYDGDRLERAFRRAALTLTAHGLIQGVVSPLLQRIGEAWEKGTITPAQEHLASGVAMRTLGWVLETSEPEPDAPRAVVATPSGQRHNLGALLAAATAAAAGWRVSYLGGDLPGDEIARAAREIGARAVALSLVHPESTDFLEDLRQIGSGTPGDVALLVGGRAAEAERAAVADAGWRLLADYGDLRRALEELRG